MAVVNVLSVSISDPDGDVKSLPLYLPVGPTVAQIQAFADDFITALDAAIDGKVEAASLTLGLTLPGGLKGTAVAPSDVERGALLAFDIEDSNYRHSIFVPTWEPAGFTGKTVNNSGVYATLINAILADPNAAGVDATSKEGADLTAYIEGKKTFRK